MNKIVFTQTTRRYELHDDILIMIYSPESLSLEKFQKLVKNYESEKKVYIQRNTFKIRSKFILKYDYENEEVYIKIGAKKGDYIFLDKEIFDIDYNFAFDDSITLHDRLFMCYGNKTTSIIKSIANVAKHDTYIDKDESFKDEEGHINYSNYLDIISKFPNYDELSKYKDKVIFTLLEDFFDKLPNYNEKYENYITKHRNLTFNITNNYDNKIHNASQIKLYLGIKKELEDMLNDDSISEMQWQQKIFNILLLLYPRYLYILQKVQFTSMGKQRELDYVAIDNEGNLDIIEIKKASIGSLLRKHPYRKNYIPTKELEGSIVQCEKYLYLLNSNKTDIEKALNNKFNSVLKNIKIKIVNPQAIIIAGKSDQNSEQEKEDLEIIKRMHKNVSEILTYNNLIERLDNAIGFLKDKINYVELE